jgi:hypothetical protein
MSNDNLDSASGLKPVSDKLSNGTFPEPATNAQKDYMTCSSQVTVGPIKKVDVGNSDAVGDVARASIDKAAGKGPRAGMNQESLNSKLKANAPGTVNNYPSDQGAVNS